MPIAVWPFDLAYKRLNAQFSINAFSRGILVTQKTSQAWSFDGRVPSRLSELSSRLGIRVYARNEYRKTTLCLYEVDEGLVDRRLELTFSLA